MSRILVVDDRAALREELVEILILEGFEVLEAEDGPQGVQQAFDHHPDLIICDVMLPKLDGFGVLRELLNDPNMASIPVIFLSARADKDSIQEGLDLGGAGYLTKPFSLMELLTVIRTHLPD